MNGNKKRIIRWLILAVGMSIGLVTPPAAVGDMALSVDTTMMSFEYTSIGDRPIENNVVGQIDIRLTPNSATNVRYLDMGADGDVGGVDDILRDAAKHTGVASPNSASVLSCDVFQLASNTYAVFGTYQLFDVTTNLKIEGVLDSNLVALVGGALYIGGPVTNPDGILRPGSPKTSWSYTGNASETPDIIDGVLGGADGVDGQVSIPGGRGLWSDTSLIEFQVLGGGYASLDDLFNQSYVSATAANANLTVKPVPEPGAVVLGVLGVGFALLYRSRTQH